MRRDLLKRFGSQLAVIVTLTLLGGACSSCRQGNDAEEPTGTVRVSEVSDPSAPLRKVRFSPYWVPSAQFAGYYVGIEKGFFKKHGIDLEILPFDPSGSVETLIREKKTDFAVLWMVNAIEMKINGLDIINIGQMSFRSSLMLITKKSSGIEHLEQMNGKRAGIWLGYERQPQALFRKHNLEVEMVPIGSSNSLFLLDAVDILNANWFDEYHAILNNGINEDELNRFFFADYGLNFLEDGIYCLNEVVREDPDLCRRMMSAILEGWSYAFDHQEETIEIVVNYAKALNQPVNRPHQRWMLSHYRSLYIPEGSDHINTMLHEADFSSIQAIMQENGCIDRTIPFESFFKHYATLPAKR